MDRRRPEWYRMRVMKTPIAFAALVLALTSVCLAQDVMRESAPTDMGPMDPAETAFVQSIRTDLSARFPTAADAEKDGYVRYTGQDEYGATMYANFQWQSADSKHPAQLWYDRNGMLLGANFSVLKTNDVRPRLWGINPGRWWIFASHVHWVIKDPATGKTQWLTKDPANGKMISDLWIPAAQFAAAGGNLSHPNAATLVKLGKVASANEVVMIFSHPALWDLTVWVKPNPNGAFALENPNVTP